MHRSQEEAPSSSSGGIKTPPLPPPPSVPSRAGPTPPSRAGSVHLAGDRGHTRYALCRRLLTGAMLLLGALGCVWRQFWSFQLGVEGGGRAPGARRPGMLLKTLQGTGRPPPQRIVRRQVSTALKSRKPARGLRPGLRRQAKPRSSPDHAGPGERRGTAVAGSQAVPASCVTVTESLHVSVPTKTGTHFMGVVTGPAPRSCHELTETGVRCEGCV